MINNATVRLHDISIAMSYEQGKLALYERLLTKKRQVSGIYGSLWGLLILQTAVVQYSVVDDSNTIVIKICVKIGTMGHKRLHICLVIKTMILEFLGLNFKNKNPRSLWFWKLQRISSNQNTTINLSLFIKVKVSYYFGVSLIKSTMWVRRFVTVPYIVYLFLF